MGTLINHNTALAMSIIDQLMAIFKKKQSVEETKQDAIVMKKPTTQKYTSKMVNSVSFSSDMKTLYLIDNGRAIDFPIDSKRGILVGTLNGQITVVTGLMGQEDASPGSGDDPSLAIAARPAEPIKLSTKGNQYTAFYNPENEVMAIIGVTDIDISISQPEDSDCDHYVFDMKEKTLRVRRIGNALEIEALDK